MGRDLNFKKKRILQADIQNYMSYPLRTILSSCVTEWLEFKQKVIPFSLEVSENRAVLARAAENCKEKSGKKGIMEEILD